MAKITVSGEKCKGCLLCIHFCPKGLISKSPGINKLGAHFAVFEKGDNSCIGCAFCAIICPDCCIEVYK